MPGLAPRKLVQAFYHNGTLAIFATGEVPSPCHEVAIETTGPEVQSPQFVLTQSRRPGICTRMPTAYAVSRLFGIGAYRAAVVVAHAGGRDEVAVQRVREHVPVSGPAAELPMPYVLPPSAAGSSGDGVAIGYSQAFELREAIEQAIAALRPLPPAASYPDALSAFVVLEIGVELGGIAGFHHLYVRLRRERDSGC